MARTVRLTAFCSFNDTIPVRVTRVAQGKRSDLSVDFVSVSEMIRTQFSSSSRRLYVPRRAV